jgi:hypothetical protein
MRRYALVLSGILLTASCATVRNLGSYGLEDNPNVYSTLRIAGYFIVTHFDNKDVDWRISRWARICHAGPPDAKYAEMRISPGLHDLQFDLLRCDQFSLKPLHISYDFRAGRTYLLGATFGGERRGSTLFHIEPKITVVADS